MKKILLVAFSLLSLAACVFAAGDLRCDSKKIPAPYGRIYVTNNRADADCRVYVTKNRADADCRVYVTKHRGDMMRPGIWYFTNNRADADYKIYYTNNRPDADCKIYFTNNRGDAGE